MKFIDFKIKKYLLEKMDLLGGAIYKVFRTKEPRAKYLIPSSKQLDLTNLNKTENWFKKNRPDYVVIAAAKASGILII